MADFTRREVTVTRVEYVLPNPTNWAEIGKVVAAINHSAPESITKWDDTVTVEGRDDEIILSYRKEAGE